MAVQIDRSEASRALAKVIAYKGVGNEVEAYAWFGRLALLLGYEKNIQSVRVYEGPAVKERGMRETY